MKMFRPFILAIASLIVTAGSVGARSINVMSYQAMFDESDLVVIAKPVSTRDTPEKTILPGIGPDIHVVGMSTQFEVSVVIKGDKSPAQILLHHYRLANSDNELDDRTNVFMFQNGPELVSFDPAKKKASLLFLKKEADGRFAPINGQVDPGACAISPADAIDFVVIAKPASAKKQVDGDQTTLPDEVPTIYLTGYHTEFAVQGVLKGDKSAKQFVLHHYEQTGRGTYNPHRDPWSLNFKPDPDQSYILLLNNEAAGLFRPIPGSLSVMRTDGFPVMQLGAGRQGQPTNAEPDIR